MISHVGRRAVAASIAANTPLVGFAQIKAAVAHRFQAMGAHELFRTAADKDAMWARYLASFPPGTNPVFRKRTEHDCGCCRQFIRTVGNVVAIIDGKLVSIWDIDVQNDAYGAVALAMSDFVKSHPIDNRFLHHERSVGTDRNFEDMAGEVKTWNHFHVQIPDRNERTFVCPNKDIGPRLSEARALHDVMFRSLTELSLDAADTIIELIGQNSLYRGEEHRHAVAAFREQKIAFDALAQDQRDAFVWLKTCQLPTSVSKIRNTSIGTLLTDLSQGRDLEGAVKAFEAMVAPANYKRPTSLVTKAMVDKARATVAELGLTSALDRRYARLTDITVNNILFADRSARKAMAGDVFDNIAAASAVKPKTFDKVEEIGIDKFMSDVLPRAESIEMLVENRHAGNFVSLIAPADPGALPLFKWDNRFSWSYAGDFADSIKERVKKAGGNVSGHLCCRLAWFNRDDLDFHMIEPNRYEIFFANRHSPSPCLGRLDVDMNVSGETREPVENIFYPSASRMAVGRYVLFVYQYRQRETADAGFEVEFDFKGDVQRFAYPKPVRQGERVIVVEFNYTRAGTIEIVNSLPSSSVSRNVWGVDTEAFHRVNVVMLSPNHWDGQGVGNRHFFFMLAGCRNDGTARGFYNEFLRGELNQHRKVFEIVGAKMRAEEAPDQLSGLGFSSTQRNHAVVRVKGAFSRTVKVVF